MPIIYVDADACPVKNEIFKVATRYGLPVKLVTNTPMWKPEAGDVEVVVVSDGFDAADDWIVEQAVAHDIVVTSDIPLAARSLKKGARALGHKGRIFTEDSIGGAMASREVSAQLREHGMMGGGPAPMSAKDRSQFLQSLDNAVQASLRELK